MPMNRTAALVAASLVSAAGLFGAAAYAGNDSSYAAAEMTKASQDKPFYQWLTVDLINMIKANPSYSRLPLDSQAQTDEFTGWLHALYRQRITADQFKQTVLAKYPGHEHEVNFIVSSLPPVGQRH